MHEQHHHRHPQAPDMGHYAAEIDRRYPELYHRLMPYIEDAHMMHRDILRMNERQLDMVTQEVIQNSGILLHMPRGHSEETVRDIVRVLLLTQDGPGPAVEAISPLLPWALGPFPFFHPFPFFYGRPFHHRRHHRHGFRGHRRGRR